MYKTFLRVAVNTYVPIFRGLGTRGDRDLRTDTNIDTHTYTHTHTHTQGTTTLTIIIIKVFRSAEANTLYNETQMFYA